MIEMQIRAGTLEELKTPTGDWVFIDVGFSCKDNSCGYVNDLVGGETEPEALEYGEVRRRLAKVVTPKGPPLHLVLEAPLSAAFQQNGNPIGRNGEKRGSDQRYWNNGLACGPLVASLFLLNDIRQCSPGREVRLFEALVSFKSKPQSKEKKGRTSSDHIQDVKDIRQVVWSRGETGGRLISAEPMKQDKEESIVATLALMGLDLSPPPIIEVVK